MSSTNSKTSCVMCDKSIGQFKCEGCSQTFCTKHVTQHRQALSQQLDEVILQHDIFQQTINEEKHSNQNNCFISAVDEWEQKSIEKIRQIAKEIREQVNQLANTNKKTTIEKMNHLKEEIKKAREEDDFFENNLREWNVQLDKLKQELPSTNSSSSSSYIKEDQTLPLIYQIRIFPLYEDKSTNSVSKLHPRLKYTNQDGIYVNPRSFFITAIWYFYSPKRNKWFWTPCQNYESWMSVDTLIVKSGFYKDQIPALINVEIIEYLRQHNPLPPQEIIDVASQSEDRLLKI